MAEKRVLVLMHPNDPDDLDAGYGSLGTPAELRDKLGRFNTAPDGSPRENVGTDALHGPGVIIEYAQGQDIIKQAMITVIERDIAWPVLSRICRAYGWKMQDTESGQIFG